MIREAIERRRLEKRRIAANRVAELYPDVTGEARRKLIDKYRRYVERWTNPKKPVQTLSPENAAWIGRAVGVPPSELERPVLTEEERQLREAQRLRAKAERLERSARGETEPFQDGEDPQRTRLAQQPGRA